MRTHFIIMPSPSLDNYLRLGAGAEPFEAEAFIAELAVEALYDAILPALQTAWNTPGAKGDGNTGRGALPSHSSVANNPLAA